MFDFWFSMVLCEFYIVSIDKIDYKVTYLDDSVHNLCLTKHLGLYLRSTFIFETCFKYAMSNQNTSGIQFIPYPD